MDKRILIIGLPLSLSLSIANATILVFLWKHFITPLGVVPISIPQALGLGLIVYFLTNQESTTIPNWEVFQERFLTSLSRTITILILGYVYHLFM